jgi:hypothetical protein
MESRRSGSHVRLTKTIDDVSYHITIPAHSALRVGTLHAILHELAAQGHLSIEELAALIL